MSHFIARVGFLAAFVMLGAGAARAQALPEGWTETNGGYSFADTGLGCPPKVGLFMLAGLPESSASGKVWTCHFSAGNAVARVRFRHRDDYAATADAPDAALPFDAADLVAARWDIRIEQTSAPVGGGSGSDQVPLTTHIAFMKDAYLVECIVSSTNDVYTDDAEAGFLRRCSNIGKSHRLIRVEGTRVMPFESMAEKNETGMIGGGPAIYMREPYVYRHAVSGSFCPLFVDQFYMFEIELLSHQLVLGGDFNCKFYEFDDDDTLSFFITAMPVGTSSDGFLEKMRSYLEGTYKAPMRTDYCESPPLADGTPVIHAGVEVLSDDPEQPGKRYYVNFQTLVNGWSVEALLMAGEERLSAGCATAHKLITDVADGIVHPGFYERPANQPR
ncbi:MAG TPA: hypothetical protein PLA85_05635 [Micropepsaceae bacterium]|nr:hypothetical protein [Micropepsaceae bacterium]